MIARYIYQDIYGNTTKVLYECDKCDYKYPTKHQAENCDCKLNQEYLYKKQQERFKQLT